jgi:NAD(P) transhydrogenase
MIDKYPTPLGGFDTDLSDKFVHTFETMGGTWQSNNIVKSAHWNNKNVVVELDDGSIIEGEKLLCAAGCLANVGGLKLDNIGLSLKSRGLISVDEQIQTEIPSVYAAGDLIGPPASASTAMEQGRRAMANAYDLSFGKMSHLIPTGIYGISELSAVGLSETAAREQFGDVIIGKALFEEIARGQISGIQDEMLEIVCDRAGESILGVVIVGEDATEFIHIGQMAMLSNAHVDIFVESIFNFPTLTEAYRFAALSIIGQRHQSQAKY